MADRGLTQEPTTTAPRAAAALPHALERLASIGFRVGDTEAIRAQKSTVTIAAATIVLLAVPWVAVYLALGLPRSAAIPFAYQIITVISLVVFARTGALGPFRFSQTLLMLILPFLLQWSLGGFAASSVVTLWAVVAALGAALFYGARGSIPWFGAFSALVVVSGLIDTALARDAAQIPQPLQVLFFVLNVLGVSVTAYLLLTYFVRAREAELGRSEGLLLNILPPPIVERLKRDGRVTAEAHPDVTVLFADVVNFTPFAAQTPPDRVVTILDDIFTAFDELAEEHGLEKIKTIGDAYMAVAGLPAARLDHARAAAAMAIEMLSTMQALSGALGVDLQLRIGMASGPVIAGVIGRRKFIYDLWGDTVNTASRMESAGLPGRIQVTSETRDRLADAYAFEPRGPMEIKGKGLLTTYLLIGPRSGATPPSSA